VYGAQRRSTEEVASVGDAHAVEYDPFAPDPFPAYAGLRERCPVHHFEGFGERGFYTLSRYDDVLDLFKNVDRWSGEFGQGPQHVREGGLRSDPPEHTIYRRLATGAFTPKRTAQMAPLVQDVAVGLAEAMVPAGRAELVGAFASPLPVAIIAHVLGVPPEHRAGFRALSEQFMEAQNSPDPAVLEAAKVPIYDIFRDEMALRRRLLADGATVAGDEPPEAGRVPDDLLTSLLVARRDDRPFTDDELLPLLLLLLVGGNETTTSLIASLVYRLLALGQWERVATDPGLLDVAIEESLRFDPPVLGLFRTARGDQTVAGVTIPEGCKVDGLYAAANRDPRAFTDADEFRLDRTLSDVQRHLSFGAGIWFCPGAALARLEAATSVRVLAERLPDLRIDGDVVMEGRLVTWGVRSLPVAWTAPASGG
jgi:cytochrome P450